MNTNRQKNNGSLIYKSTDLKLMAGKREISIQGQVREPDIEIKVKEYSISKR